MKIRREKLFILLGFALFVNLVLAKLSLAREIIVNANGTGEYPTIQAAIDTSVNGDIISLQAGTYTGTGNRDIDFKGKAITVKGTTGNPKDAIIDCQGLYTNKHRGFKFVSGEDANSALKNVTITNGNGPDEDPDGNGYYSSFGGGLYCKSSNPTIQNCTITNNTANGGGIYCYNSNPVIQNCTITNNTANLGGGIFCESDSNPVIQNCTIVNNRAYDYGGGICCYLSSPNIQNCTIASNPAAYSGGGIYCDLSSPVIHNCTIINNTAAGGGGIECFFGSDPTIQNCIITDNSAIIYGGGIYCYIHSSPTIQNCIITNNTVENYGGGIYYNNYCNPVVQNCTIANNTADFGGGIFCGSNSSVIKNCIYWGNLPSQIYIPDTSSSISVSYSDIQGGFSGTGNINLAPLFESDGYHLLPNSPCINSGDPSYIAGPNETDIDDNPRIIGIRVDIGADEVTNIPNYIISGYVKKVVDNLPLGDVNIAFLGIGSTITNGQGYFSFDVPAGWSGTMSLSKAGIESEVINFMDVRVDINSTYLTNLTYGGGTGDVNDPYKIESAEHLYWLSRQPMHFGKSFIMINDIDMNEPNAAGFAGIGGYYYGSWRNPPFSGNFDGNGHVLRNLKITGVMQMDSVGLFNCIQPISGKTCVIKNVGLVNPFVTGKYAFWGTAPLIGRVYITENANVIIENCWSKGGKVDGEKGAGGLLGFLEGIVTVRNCWADAQVQTNNGGGGLIGCLNGGRVDNCYAICDVNSSQFDVGGLIGSNYDGEVNDCYARGVVRGNYGVGGFVSLSSGGKISRCYADCNVSGITLVGGFAGYADLIPPEFNACFWDIQTSPDVNGIGNGQDPNIAGKTRAEMKMLSTFTSAGWDFDSADGTPAIWVMTFDGYPILMWQIDFLTYIGGTGEPDNPYQIADSASWLKLMCTTIDWNKHFCLMGDLNLTGRNLTSVGNSAAPFTGVFDGNGHTIRNAYINMPSDSYVGLFGNLGSGGQIKNLAVADANITGSFYTGGIVGYNSGTVTSCCSSGSITGNRYIGGLIGWNDANVINCFSAASASGNYVAGLAGYNAGIVTNCYSIGYVTGRRYLGGLVSSNSGTVTASFWDTQTSGQNSSAGGTGLTTLQMKQKASFTGWDFSYTDGNPAVWFMPPDDYPILTLQISPADIYTDGRNNFKDFAILAKYWLRNDCAIHNYYCEWSDLDFSGSVDIKDIIELASYWLQDGIYN